MKKLINVPENYVNEMLEGIYLAHPDYVTYAEGDLRCLVTSNKVEGKVGIATGGGSGHLPLFLGYVGKGMLDGCSVGDVFQSPGRDEFGRGKTDRRESGCQCKDHGSGAYPLYSAESRSSGV